MLVDCMAMEACTCSTIALFSTSISNMLQLCPTINPSLVLFVCNVPKFSAHVSLATV